MSFMGNVNLTKCALILKRKYFHLYVSNELDNIECSWNLTKPVIISFRWKVGYGALIEKWQNSQSMNVQSKVWRVNKSLSDTNIHVLFLPLITSLIFQMQANKASILSQNKYLISHRPLHEALT